MFINNTYIHLNNIHYKSHIQNYFFLLITILETVKIILPRFCYHDQLTTSGNCRMCLVELKGSTVPLVSCSTIVTNNMVVYTHTSLLRKSQEYIIEFILLNHPLDCPICDQSGECDLQDISLIFGSDKSRLYSSKKSIVNKYLGYLIKTEMNRCIYCTRCVRYTSEINNIYTFNTLGRGGSTEISNYYSDNSSFYSSFINGNVIDLCPVCIINFN